MKEFEMCRQRTPEEDAAVVDAEWRLTGYPDEAELQRVDEELADLCQRYTWLRPLLGEQ